MELFAIILICTLVLGTLLFALILDLINDNKFDNVFVFILSLIGYGNE